MNDSTTKLDLAATLAPFLETPNRLQALAAQLQTAEGRLMTAIEALHGRLGEVQRQLRPS